LKLLNMMIEEDRIDLIVERIEEIK
jgi:hypothetical protein